MASSNLKNKQPIGGDATRATGIQRHEFVSVRGS